MAEDKTSIQVGDTGDEDRQGGEGIDIMDLGGGDDSASSGGGAFNIVLGGSGDDNLTGDGFFDVVLGGSGDDTITDFNVAHDKIHLRCFDETITWDVLSTKITTVTDANDVVTGVQIDLSDWGGGTVILEGVTSVSDLTEDIFYLDTLAGADDSNDKIEGGTSDDTMTGGTGSDTFVFDEGHGDDAIEGTSRDERLTGGEGADTFVRTYGSNILT